MKKLRNALLATAVLSSGVMATEVGFYAGGGLAFEAVPNNSQNWEMGLGIVLRGGMTLDAVLENFLRDKCELIDEVVRDFYIQQGFKSSSDDLMRFIFFKPGIKSFTGK